MTQEIKREFVILFCAILVIAGLSYELYERIEEAKIDYLAETYLADRMNFFKNQWQACEGILDSYKDEITNTTKSAKIKK